MFPDGEQISGSAAQGDAWDGLREKQELGLKERAGSQAPTQLPTACAGENLGTRGFPYPRNGPWLASVAEALRGFTAAKGFLFWVFKTENGVIMIIFV